MGVTGFYIHVVLKWSLKVIINLIEIFFVLGAERNLKLLHRHQSFCFTLPAELSQSQVRWLLYLNKEEDVENHTVLYLCLL